MWQNCLSAWISLNLEGVVAPLPHFWGSELGVNPGDESRLLCSAIRTPGMSRSSSLAVLALPGDIPGQKNLGFIAAVPLFHLFIQTGSTGHFQSKVSQLGWELHKAPGNDGIISGKSSWHWDPPITAQTLSLSLIWGGFLSFVPVPECFYSSAVAGAEEIHGAAGKERVLISEKSLQGLGSKCPQQCWGHHLMSPSATSRCPLQGWGFQTPLGSLFHGEINYYCLNKK